jgi:hypothetical protein
MAMKRISISVLLVLLAATACLEPPRDNPYDPNNPDKGYLAGTAYDHNVQRLEGALVTLKIGNEEKYSTQTDIQGDYEFTAVDPGLYTLVADAEYYSTLTDSVEIKSYTHNDTFDLYFQEQYFDFENEALGTQEPFGFRSVLGTWQVAEDYGEPSQHSVPKVYNAQNSGVNLSFTLAVLRDTLDDFRFGTGVKVLGSSGGLWRAGLILRYQDANNLYLVQFATGALSLVKIQNGSPVQLHVDTLTFATDTWYFVAAHLYGNHIRVYLNSAELFDIQDTSSPFLTGVTGMFVRSDDPTGQASANFDDVYVVP